MSKRSRSESSLSVSRHDHRRRHRHHHRHSKEDEVSSSSSSQEGETLHPLGYYINDRSQMIEQVFSIIKGAKLKAMLTSSLREMDLETLKEECLIQLEGMSKKRIRHVLAGTTMEESSNTEDDDDEEEDNNHHDPDNLFNPSIRNYKQKNDHSSDDEHNQEKKSSEDEADFMKNNREKITMNDDDNQISNKKKINVKLSNNKSISSNKPIVTSVNNENPVGGGGGEGGGGKSVMELLELEMRARAIKALLNKSKESPNNEQEGGTGEDKTPSETAQITPEQPCPDVGDKKEKEEGEEGGKDLGNDQKVEILSKDEVLRRQKAREVLEISENKKKEEDEKLERKHSEIRRNMERQAEAARAEVEAREKKEKEEADKKLEKIKKEEEYQKFLKWKEERKKIEDLKRQEEELMWKDRTILETKEKLLQMRENEETERRRDYESRASESLIKKKIDRVQVDVKPEDEEDPDIEINLEFDDFAEETREFERQNEEPPSKTRRYRRNKRDSKSRSRSRSYSPNNYDDDRKSFSDNSSTDDEERLFQSDRIKRAQRMKLIRNKNRKKKNESDIEDGEVDSDGEHFEPVLKKSKKDSNTDDVDSETDNSKMEQHCHSESPGKSVNNESNNDKSEMESSSSFPPPLPNKTIDEYQPEPNNDDSLNEEDVKIQPISSDDKTFDLNQEIVDMPEKSSNLQVDDTQMELEQSTKVTPPSESPKRILETDLKKIIPESEKIILKNDIKKKPTQKRKGKLKKHVFIEDDSDNEKIFTSSDEEEEEHEKSPRKKLRKSPKKSKKESKKESSGDDKTTKTEDDILLSKLDDQGVEGNDDEEDEEKETEEEREIRERHEQEEKKRKEKMEKIRLERIKRIQAFQQRTEIAEKHHHNINEEEDEEQKEPDKDHQNEEVKNEIQSSNEQIEPTKPINDFYASYYKAEEKEKEKCIQEEVDIPTENSDTKPTDDASNIVKDIKKSKTRKKKKKSSEEKIMEGVGYWSRLCESQGDFHEDIESGIASKSPIPSTSKREEAYNRDLPGKEQVEREQAEFEASQTWADRWYQNKRVKNVVEESKRMSKVRKQIKVKIDLKNKTPINVGDPEKEGIDDDGGGFNQDYDKNKAISGLPKKGIIGSLKEYAEIVGKSVDEIEASKVEPFHDDNIQESENEDDDEEDDDDNELWGAIMGK